MDSWIEPQDEGCGDTDGGHDGVHIGRGGVDGPVPGSSEHVLDFVTFSGGAPCQSLLAPTLNQRTERRTTTSKIYNALRQEDPL